jgi:hypothetical protein
VLLCGSSRQTVAAAWAGWKQARALCVSAVQAECAYLAREEAEDVAWGLVLVDLHAGDEDAVLIVRLRLHRVLHAAHRTAGMGA